MTNPTSNERLYAKRDHYALSPHFERHMLALTSEELQSKSAIAAELAHRDAEIERLTLEFRLSSQQAAALRDERERLRAALLYWRNECSGREPSLSVFERMIDRSLSGDSSTSSDGSGRPTVPNDAVNATTSTGPGPSDETSHDDAARYRWMKEHWIGFECKTKDGPMRLIANIDKDLDGWIDACRFNRLYEPSAQETKPKPTIEGLERLLQAEDSKQVYVWPDGYVHDTPPPEKAPEAHIDYNVPGCDCLGCELAPKTLVEVRAFGTSIDPPSQKATASYPDVCGKPMPAGKGARTCINVRNHEGPCDDMPF